MLFKQPNNSGNPLVSSFATSLTKYLTMNNALRILELKLIAIPNQVQEELSQIYSKSFVLASVWANTHYFGSKTLSNCCLVSF